MKRPVIILAVGFVALCLNACGTMQFNGVSVGVNKLAIDQQRMDQYRQAQQNQQMLDMQRYMQR